MIIDGLHATDRTNNAMINKIRQLLQCFKEVLLHKTDTEILEQKIGIKLINLIVNVWP